MSDAEIKHMVQRFLSWRLPENFRPDAGISFKAEFNEHTAHPMRHEPTGTNLFDATQAEAMVRYMVDGLSTGEADLATVREELDWYRSELAKAKDLQAECDRRCEWVDAARAEAAKERARAEEWKREAERREEMLAKPEERKLWADANAALRAALEEAKRALEALISHAAEAESMYGVVGDAVADEGRAALAHISRVLKEDK